MLRPARSAQLDHQDQRAHITHAVHKHVSHSGRPIFRKRTRRLIFTWLTVLVVIAFLLQPFGASPLPFNPFQTQVASADDPDTPDPPTPDTLSASEQDDPHLPSLHLSMEVNPRTVSVRDVFTITLTVLNMDPDAATNLTVTLPLPEGASSYPDPNSYPDGWTWTQSSLGADSTVTFTATLQLDQSPTGDAVLAFPAATAAGLDMPVKEVGGALVVPSSPTTTTTTYSSGTATSMNSDDGTVHLECSIQRLRRFAHHYLYH